ncbi:glucose 1-dehydrogenase [Candidatus Atribacteria bacterium 1244-E10-H5-B2]|nr:MAG: glucose 1-dehydrogenase [Candidatus Atribacteria bacterium 1244-E10-H5-B2]
MNFKDKVVIVTGAAVGIGRATAIAFAEKNAKVIVADIDIKKGKQISSLIGGNAFFIETDVANSGSVKNMVKEVTNRFERINILVNNAGIYYQGDVIETPEKEWDKVIAVNLKGMYLCSHYIIPVMLAGNGGVVINVASEAGLVGIAGQVAYNVSKAGAISLTKSMAVDFARKGVRVNAVCPGTTETPLVKNALKKSKDPEKARRKLEECRPLNRLGRPEEIASAILTMASDDLGYATGSILSIDGGYTAK